MTHSSQHSIRSVDVSMGSTTLLSDGLIILDGASCYMPGIVLNIITTILLVLVLSGQCSPCSLAPRAHKSPSVFLAV